MKQDIEETIAIPDGIQVTVDDLVTVKGPKGELSKNLKFPGISLKLDGKQLKISAENATKREKKLIYTYKAHLANMFQGVQEPWVYKLKVCASHFPMNVSVSGKEFIVKNFLGEKVPRKLLVREGVTVKIDGKDVIVESIDKELAGNTASEIELLTVVKGRDLRVFQDGIYITEKAGKPIK